MSDMRGYTGGEPSLDERDEPYSWNQAEEAVEDWLRRERDVLQTAADHSELGNVGAADALVEHVVDEMQRLGVAEGFFTSRELTEYAWDFALELPTIGERREA